MSNYLIKGMINLWGRIIFYKGGIINCKRKLSCWEWLISSVEIVWIVWMGLGM